jgi:ribosomal protein S27AE
MAFRTDRMLEIETLLDQLQKENAELKRKLKLSLKGNGQCPRCESKSVAFAESILDRSDSGRERLAVIQPSFWSGKTKGEFYAYICGACGYVEWYVKKPDELLAE